MRHHNRKSLVHYEDDRHGRTPPLSALDDALDGEAHEPEPGDFDADWLADDNLERE